MCLGFFLCLVFRRKLLLSLDLLNVLFSLFELVDGHRIQVRGFLVNGLQQRIHDGKKRLNSFKEGEGLIAPVCE